MKSFRHGVLAALALIALGASPAEASNSCRRAALADAAESGTTPSKRDQAKKDKAAQLLRVVTAIQGAGDASFLSDSVAQELSSLSGVPIDELGEPGALDRFASKLQKSLGETQAQAIAGKFASAARARVMPQENPRDDLLDMKRGYGHRLLSEYDPAFKNDLYLARLLQISPPLGSGYSESYVHPEIGRQIEKDFVAAWNKLAPRVEPIRFTQTGSDANNALYDILKGGESDPRPTEILYFEKIWAASRGRLKEAHSGKYGGMKNFLIPSPHVAQFSGPKYEHELYDLQKIEKAALAKIREMTSNKDFRVGGVLIESVLGAEGAYVFRPEFMAELRKLCDELGIAIVSDEILTGGGRTGKFFAFEHYPGFLPDYITFGKGLLLSGVAQVDRSAISRPSKWFKGFDDGTTVPVSLEVVLKATQVLKAIDERNLLANAEKVGAYFLEAMNRGLPEWDNNRGRGLGLLLVPPRFGGIPNGVEPAVNRLMPYLTLTKKDVDRLIPPPGAESRGKRRRR